ncbi:hypothetical protein ACIQC5_05325 [Paenarthrobacter sp. NPDC092416]|uniref:hypothetical protein n=1 Tax=Paenarthrobacter sp. NPDC092416 TaxID=3364386 RepID=UPI0038158FDE
MALTGCRPNELDPKPRAQALFIDMKIVGTCLFQYNYSYGNAGGFYLNCVSNCGGGATAANMVLRYNIAQDDCRLGGSSSGTGKHYIYNNTFYCPSRVFLDDMTGPRELRNNLFVAPGGGLKVASAVYANNAYFGGILPPAGETGSVLGDPQLVAGGEWADYAYCSGVSPALRVAAAWCRCAD